MSAQSDVIFSDGFEGAAIPNESWITGDTNSQSGLDYWGELDNTCGVVRSGQWSVQCSGTWDNPVPPDCHTYEPSEEAYLQSKYYFDLSGYSSYELDFYRYVDTYSNDNFRWYYSLGSNVWILGDGNVSGQLTTWTNRGIIIDNSDHHADLFAVRFWFSSDAAAQDRDGVYLDDVRITADPFLPNLTSYQPSGWAAPIVPSSQVGGPGTLYVGQTTYLDWAIQNNGQASAGSFNVSFILQDASGVSQFLGSKNVNGLSAGQTYQRLDDFLFTVSNPGTYKLRMVVDSLPPSITESNESPSDNGVTRTFTWIYPPPNLVVLSMVPTSTTPTIGQSIDVTITLKNQSNGPASGTFSTYFYQNLPTPPAQGQLPVDDIHTTFSLGPNATDTYTVYGLSSAVPVDWTMYAYVDATNNIAESNESNASTPVTVSWKAHPITPQGYLLFDDASNYTGTQATNRPIRCARIELWESDTNQVPSSPDDKLEDGFTDENGHYVFSTRENRDVDVDQGPLDLYVKVYLQSSAPCAVGDFYVVEPDTLNTWWFTTPLVQDATGDLGTYKPTGYRIQSALNIYDGLWRGYKWAHDLGVAPKRPWRVKAVWDQNYPEKTGYSSSANGPFLNINGTPGSELDHLNPDEWDTATILHEYGHHLENIFAFGNLDFNNATCPGGHTLAEETQCPPGSHNPFLAFDEGWADYFACATRGNLNLDEIGAHADYSQWGSIRLNEETGDYYEDGAWRINTTGRGWTWEGCVAQVLWDLYDSGSEGIEGCTDLMNGDIVRPWTCVTDFPYDPNNITSTVTTINDLYYQYCNRFLLQSPPLKHNVDATFCLNGMNTSDCTIAVGVGDEPVGGKVALEVYGNPAVGSATLKFFVGRDEPVRLRVYDLAGRRIRTLFEGTANAGRHQVQWDGKGEGGAFVGAGMFLCRLDSPDGTCRKNVLFMR